MHPMLIVARKLLGRLEEPLSAAARERR